MFVCIEEYLSAKYSKRLDDLIKRGAGKILRNETPLTDELYAEMLPSMAQDSCLHCWKNHLLEFYANFFSIEKAQLHDVRVTRIERFTSTTILDFICLKLQLSNTGG